MAKIVKKLQKLVGTIAVSGALLAISGCNGIFESSLAGQSVIDLGAYGKLIAPVQVNGKWYYYWDRSGDGTSANIGSLNGGMDYTTHNVLDELFNHDINGVVNTTLANADGAYGTTDDYRYATINGVKLALPTRGVGLIKTYYYNLADNLTYTDLAEIWDTHNSGYYTNGTPSGWNASYYWSATTSASGHAIVYLGYGSVSDTGDTDDTYVALQVL